MAVSNHSYSGFYCNFDTRSKKEGSMLMGADSLVGDELKVSFKTDNGQVTVWLHNKFDAEVGFLDIDASRKLQIANARDLKIRAVLSFVAYSDEPDPGHYWGQVAIFIYNPAYEETFDVFVNNCKSSIANNTRPNIDLGNQAVQKLFEDRNWLPKETVSLPKNESGFAILKSQQKYSEKLIEMGRAKNKGCYVVSWLFIILVIAGIVFGLHLLGLF